MPDKWSANTVRKKRRAGWNDRTKLSSAKRGYGHAWRKLRLVVLERDSGLCQVCLANGVHKSADAVDHIKNKARGGTDDLDNLRAICNDCHADKTQQESRYKSAESNKPSGLKLSV